MIQSKACKSISWNGRNASRDPGKRTVSLSPVYLVFAFIALVAPPPLLALPLNTELFDQLRSGRWSTIVNRFRGQSPSDPAQRYALARALEEEKGLHTRPAAAEALPVMAEYLRAAGVFCQGDLRPCVESARPSARGVLANLALMRAARLADHTGNQPLRAAILLHADLSRDNPVARRLFAESLVSLHGLHQYDRALAHLNRNPQISGASANQGRGKILAALNRRTEALDAFLRAAGETGASYLLRSLYQDVTKLMPDYPATAGLNDRQRRGAVFFSEFMPVQKIGLSPERIIASTSAETMLSDGMYLIRSGQQQRLNELAGKGYTYLSRETDILKTWSDELKKRHQRPTALALLRQFLHAKRYSSQMWKAYIDLLADGNKDVYFNEILEYLSVHHSDIGVHDRLITFLIGDDVEHIRWAPQSYWETAANRLPHQTGSGRFVYWLWRYYREKFPGRAKEVEENFYRHAPGSYYSVAFWEKSARRDFQADWYSVANMEGYARWISLNGGNDEALRFLARKNLYSYYNQDAIRLSRELYQEGRQVDHDVVDVLSAGEIALGFEFFREKYGNKPDVEYLKSLVSAGIRSRNRFVEVYYLRGLLRQLNIAEDPFTLPPRMVEALYPRPYRPAVQKSAREWGMHEDMIYGLMRQESMFREVAESHSGALGLMQIMPKTGSWLAQRMGIKEYNLTDPETSIRLGTRFFADLMRQSEQDFRWASIAYNGGPGSMRKWKRQYYRGDFNYFLEVLPVEESRNYVRKTYENYLHYHVARILYDPGIR